MATEEYNERLSKILTDMLKNGSSFLLCAENPDKSGYHQVINNMNAMDLAIMVKALLQDHSDIAGALEHLLESEKTSGYRIKAETILQINGEDED